MVEILFGRLSAVNLHSNTGQSRGFPLLTGSLDLVELVYFLFEFSLSTRSEREHCRKPDDDQRAEWEHRARLAHNLSHSGQ